MARWRNLLRSRGSTAIEYAIILPAVLLFIFGLIDIGRLLWNYSALNRATEAAARCAAINTTTCGTTAQIQSFAASQAWGLDIAASAFTVATVTCGKQVSGAYTFVFVIPGVGTALPLGSVALSAVACYPA